VFVFIECKNVCECNMRVSASMSVLMCVSVLLRSRNTSQLCPPLNAHAWEQAASSLLVCLSG